MRTCRNCDGGLYAGPRPYQIDEMLCRECQKSPAVQVRVLLERAREQGFTFQRAWTWALGARVERDGRADFIGGRVRWPHDTSHRHEWKAVLGTDDSFRVWQECFERRPPAPSERNLAHLAVAA